MSTQRAADIDWQALFFDSSSGWPKRLQALAWRRFGESEDADAAYNFVFDEVSREGWRRLSEGFGQRGSASGFLAVTLTNLLEDYATKKYGRKRPPAWLTRLGTMWKRVHQMLCLQRLEPETIVDVLCAHTEHEPTDVRNAIREIKARVPNCGQYTGETNLPEDSEIDQRAGDEQDVPAQSLALQEYKTVIDVLRHMVNDKEHDVGEDDDETLIALQGCLSISATERLLLRLIYQQGFSLPRAARSMKLHEQKARRSHKALLERLRKCLIDNGF